MKQNQQTRPSILIIDDEEGIRHGLKNLFQKQGFRVLESDDFERAVFLSNTDIIDVALVDIRLKGSKNGIELIRELKKVEPDMIIVVITGYGSIDTAVTSIKEGASDYILKPIDNRNLLDTVQKNLQLRKLKNEYCYLRNELLNRHSFNFLTCNPGLRLILDKADRIKNSPVTVLISGESGTGKEVLARYIHFTSNRKDFHFVPINCAALSENLLLSELFGHEKGAFTGAIKRKTGKIEIADKGTLFLDEIGDMPMEVQAKLLRVIEEKSFERVGGTKKIQVDIRIITATNKDLTKLIEEKTFRKDLFYRINVVNFYIPPLRERKEDIPLLVENFIKKYSQKYNKRLNGIEQKALSSICSHNWPGNIRELENVINQTVLLCDGPIIKKNDLKKCLFAGSAIERHEFSFSAIRSLKQAIEEIKNDYEKSIIQHFLQKNMFNKSRTAKELHITRKTLTEKIQKYKLI